MSWVLRQSIALVVFWVRDWASVPLPQLATSSRGVQCLCGEGMLPYGCIASLLFPLSSTALFDSYCFFCLFCFVYVWFCLCLFCIAGLSFLFFCFVFFMFTVKKKARLWGVVSINLNRLISQLQLCTNIKTMVASMWFLVLLKCE